jgi:hypothetical protein
MQVVLANGSIVTASKDENADLYLALKGGSLNTGIVTRFELEAFPAQNLSYGTQIMSMKYSKDFEQAMVDFINHQPENDALVPLWTRMPDTGNETVVIAIKVNTLGDPNTTAFAAIEDIAAIEDTGKHPTCSRAIAHGIADSRLICGHMLTFTGTDVGMLSMSLADAAAGSQVAAGYRTFWRVLTFANNVNILNKSVQLHEVLVRKLLAFLSAADFSTMMIPQ